MYVPCHNTRNCCELCNTSIPVPETSASSVKLPYPYPESTNPTEHNLEKLHPPPAYLEVKKINNWCVVSNFFVVPPCVAGVWRNGEKYEKRNMRGGGCYSRDIPGVGEVTQQQHNNDTYILDTHTQRRWHSKDNSSSSSRESRRPEYRGRGTQPVVLSIAIATQHPTTR